MSYDAKKKVTLGQVKTLAQAAAAGGGASPTAFSFSAGAWKAGGGGVTLTLTAAQHGRSSGDFVYQVYSRLADGSYQSGTWNAVGVGVQYLSSGSVKLTAPEAFAGKIVFL